MEKIEIKKNTIIFEAGHKADAVYLILKGEIGIFLPQNNLYELFGYKFL